MHTAASIAAASTMQSMQYALPESRASGQKLRQDGQVDVSAAEDDADLFSRDRVRLMERRCGPQASCRFHHQLHPLRKEFHGLDELSVRHRDDVVYIALDDLEVALADMRYLCSVRDGIGYRNVHDFPFAQRLLSIVAELGLDPNHLAFWTEPRCGESRTSQQAAAKTDQQHIELAD